MTRPQPQPRGARPDPNKVTARPWHVEPANWEFHAHVAGPAGEVLSVGEDADPDLAFIVYAANNIEACETRLARARELLDLMVHHFNREAIDATIAFLKEDG